MEKKTIMFGSFVALLSMLLCLPKAHAQNGVDAIRNHYYAVKQRIEQMEAVQLPSEYYQVKVAQNLPGTGGHEEVVNMYYGERDDHEIWPSHWLEFVTTHYNFAVREYYEEYLYNENGDIAFIFASNPDVEFGCLYEFRLYFNDGGLIKVNIRRHTVDKTDYIQVYDGDEIPQEYQSYYNELANRVKVNRILYNAVDEGKRS